MYNYGLVGNCQVSALISQSGSIEWLCFPRPDSPPVFGKLLDSNGGEFSIEDPSGSAVIEQSYIPNTNILVTLIQSQDGSKFKITDFCPRFHQHGRIYRPNAIFRIVEPVAGNPMIRVRCKPVSGWEKELVKPVRGNSHLKFEMRDDYLRLVTNMPLTYLCEETPFVLKEPLYFGLTWSSGIEEDLPQVTRHFLEQTLLYWRTWVQHCSIPSLYQKQTIRSALTLKLHCYEDTGAILAALTTSLPEECGSNRNWDYRFCWLRDSYYVLSAFHNLGHFEEMEGFLKFLLGIAYRHEHSRDRLRPVYSLDQSLPIPEKDHSQWEGYSKSSPVRSNNQAAEHVQNDVYGEMILTLAPIFFDERFQHLRTRDHEELLQNLAKHCVQSISQPDAGLWELRNGWQEHSFSNLMSWAGIERMIRIKEAGFLNRLDIDLLSAKDKAEKAIIAATRDGSLRNGPNDPSFDSALLQLSSLRYPDLDLCKKTTEAIAKELQLGSDSPGQSFLYRYLRKDDFGTPQSSFLLCTFWLIHALARQGQIDQARKVMNDAITSANHLGLFAEHFSPGDKRQCGNFPQAYSHVGQINASFAISPPWEHIL
jgi:GH15 family glucan-1,4-alpha-glucosidase